MLRKGNRMLRLDKFLCEMKTGTRSQVKALVKKGAVTVNGITAKSPEQKIDENSDCICVNGSEVSYRKYVYFMLHKPAGYVSATRDNHDKTVLDLMREQKNPLLDRELFPVGRLDKDTEGLLLITDDGELAHRLLSPSRHVPKTYYVEIDGCLSEDQQMILRQGVDIGEKQRQTDDTQEYIPEKTRPAGLTQAAQDEFCSDRAESAWLLTITEGKFHQVKRMMQAVGRNVVYLKRLSMGELRLDEKLARGEFRELTKDEAENLM